MKCANCIKDIENSMKFCPYCRQLIKRQCYQCGAKYEIGYLFCSQCGVNLSGNPSEMPLPASGADHSVPATNTSYLSFNHDIEQDIEDIRKHATVLFADIKDSTAIVEGLDPEEAKNILLPSIDAMCEAIYSYGGTMIKTAGDGIVAVFGAPLALEDHALRACLAALSIHNNVATINPDLKVRVGLHSGEVYLEVIKEETHKGYDIAGQTVNLAARMEQTAIPGTVRLTKNTFCLVEKDIQAKSMGALEIKGFSQPIEVFELQGAIKNNKILSEVKERPTFLPFIGRKKEMDILNQLAEQAKSGQGNAVSIIAEAGQGKSRLLYEFIHEGTLLGNFDVLITGGFSHTHHTPYYPLVQALQQWMGIMQKETEENAYAKIQPYLDKITVPYAAEALLVLFGLPSNNPAWNNLEHALKRKYQFETIMALLFNAAMTKPLVFIIEDSYWIDSETEAFLDVLISHLHQSRVLLILTSRPEYVNHWIKRQGYTQIKLEALSQDDEALTLNILLGNHPSLQKIKTQLSQNCAGNPFFLEEMIKSLIHDKILIGTVKNYQLSEKALASKLQLPESIFAVLQTQLDSLSPLERKILRMASVIGERFTYKMLTKIMDNESDESIQQGLRVLTANQYIYETHIYPEPESAFKHALIHEVTYNSLLKSLRRSMHVKILSILESLPMEEQDLQLQAYHAYQGESWEKAFYYCHQAAHDMFFSLSANKSAAILYEKSLAAANHLTKTKEVLEKCLRIHMYLIIIYRRLCQLQDEGRHIKETEELLLLPENKDQQPIKTLFYSAMGSYYLSLGDIQQSMQWYTESRNASVLCEDQMMKAVSESSCAYIYLFVGQYKTLYTQADKALRLFPTLGYRHELFPLPMGHFTNWMKSWAQAYTGDAQSTKNVEEQVQTLISSTDIEQSTLDAVYVSMAIGWLYFYQELFDKAIDHLSRALMYATELEILQYVPSIAAALGCAYLRLDQQEEGKKFTEQAIAMFNSNESYLPKMLALDLITEALLLTGDYTAAKAFSRQAIDMATHCELSGIKTSLLRLDAEIDLHLPHPNYPSIEQKLYESIDNGIKLGLMLNTKRCQLILVKLYQQMGNISAEEKAEQAVYQYCQYYKEYQIKNS